MKYTFDIKTIEKNGKASIAEWASCDLKNKNIYNGVGDSMLMDHLLRKRGGSKIYTDKLNFKGRFIISFLERDGYEYTEELDEVMSPERYRKLYTVLIGRTGEWYSIDIRNDKRRIKILDASKLVPSSWEELQELYDIEEQPTKERTNSLVWASVIEHLENKDMTKSTIASNAMEEYKKIIGGRRAFNNLYPKLDDNIDEDIRRAYNGAYCYKNRDTSKSVTVMDINSMYPFIMRTAYLPIGAPRVDIVKQGPKIEDIKRLDKSLYCQFFECVVYAKLKDNHIPTIVNPVNSKVEDNSRYMTRLYGTSLMLTAYDLKSLEENYDVEMIMCHKIYSFTAKKGLFNEYIDKYYSIKSTTENKAERYIAKIMLNSLYGKFGQRLSGLNKKPTHNGYIYKLKVEDKATVYVPMAAWITSIGRFLITHKSQQVFKYYLYSDTDSIHLSLPPEYAKKAIGEFMVGDTLGKFSIEYVGTRGTYLKPKVYLLENEELGTKKMAAAGLPKKCQNEILNTIKFEDFKPGYTMEQSLRRMEPIDGGCTYKTYDYTI